MTEGNLIADANAAADAGQFQRAAGLAAEAADAESSPVRRVHILEWQLRWSVQAQDATATSIARQRLRAALADIPDPDEWVTAAGQALVFLADAGIHQDAFAVSAELVTYLESVPDAHGATTLASALMNRGNAEVALGRRGSAVETFTRAKQVIGDERSPTAANLAYNTAVALAEMNEIAAARAAYELALDIWEGIDGSESDRGYAVRGLAACFSRTGRYDKALARFNDAAALFAAAGEPDEVDLTQIGIMRARQLRGDRFDAADIEELTQTADRLAPAHRGAMLHNIGNVQSEQGDLDGAEQTFTNLREWSAGIGDDSTFAKATASLAVVERHRHDYSAAVRLNREAHAVYERLRIVDGLANAEHNYALLLDEIAGETMDLVEALELRGQAADHALAALAAFDRHRHSLPSAVDRQQLFRTVYAPALPATLRICMNAGRPADVAAVVERARVQPVLRGVDGGFLEAAPVAACHGGATVGGAGQRIVLGQLAEDLLGRDAMWLGWWSDGRRLIRACSMASSADAEQGPLDRDALGRYAACLPIVDSHDLEAAGGNEDLAATIATWRAASGPLLADPAMAAYTSALIPEPIRRTVSADEGVAEVIAWTAEQVLWPLTDMLFSPDVRRKILAAHGRGQRLGVVIAPIPLLAGIPWGALPLTDPATGRPVLLIEAADLVVGLPASLTARLRTDGNQRDQQGTVIIADPLGDLESTGTLTSPAATVLGAGSLLPATRHHLRHALDRRPLLLAVAGHVRPGTDTDPASAAILLDGDDCRIDALAVTELAEMVIPPWCLVLGCDGSGAGVGGEWTGVLTGLVWAGARQIATSTVPVIDDEVTSRLDQHLLDFVECDGPVRGLLHWQRFMCDRFRNEPSPECSPYRWATYVATGDASSR